MKRLLILLMAVLVALAGCSDGSNKEAVQAAIREGFKARAEAVFTYKDKKNLDRFFSAEALAQSRDYLNWSPNGQWANVKNLEYSTSIRINRLKTEGKRATAVVYETAVVTWDYIDPSLVTGTKFIKEDAWSNREHDVVLSLTPEGQWLIVQDIIKK